MISFVNFDLDMKGEPFVQLFQNETIVNTIGGAIYIANMNSGGTTAIFDSYFHNNFGDYGGSIRLDRAGIIVARNNVFSSSANSQRPSEKLEDILEQKELREKSNSVSKLSLFIKVSKDKNDDIESRR